MIDDRRMARLADLPMAEIDVLPFGAIRIDENGTIRTYNQYEARLSRLDAARVIGKNFFRDIAPCTAVQAFEGRMRDFIASADVISTSFDYFFSFAHDAVDVTITFVKLPNKEIMIAVERIEPAVAPG
jgi:photoactive yellow protein